MATAKNSLTPLMKQYFEIKSKYPDTILLFQVGDFYELFYEDARLAASFLGIALTARGTDLSGEPIPLCGVPIHVLDHYLTKLVKGGFKVAICDQLELPKPGKVVDRGVTQVLTPGTLTDSKLLDSKSASYLSIFFPTQDNIALLFIEILTGQIFITTINNNSKELIFAELARFMPDEIVIPDTKIAKDNILNLQRQGYIVSIEEFKPHFDNLENQAIEWFNNQFNNQNININDSLKLAIILLFGYLKRNNERSLNNFKQLFTYNPEDFLCLDASTQKNLELVKNTQDATSSNTLFAILDQAVTPMGSRTLKKWILRPLIKREAIEQRLDAVDYLVNSVIIKDKLRNILSQFGDIERIIGRISLSRAQLHDYVNLQKALLLLPEINSLLEYLIAQSLFESIQNKISDFSDLINLIEISLNQDNNKEWLIKPGYNAELDRLRSLITNANQAILELEKKEQEATKINSLKIRYNGAYGYAIEITNTHKDLVPEHYIRTQTLTNRERYTTQELKDLEHDINRAQNEISLLEKEIFESVKKEIENYISSLKKLSFGISYLDAIIALAQVAYLNSYTKPKFSDTKKLEIIDGRHPVVEKQLGSKFIPNTISLSQEQSLWIITGPNMGGKSTFLRQVALITIMAQIGSFVPAKSAELSIVDRIFTRIGAADNVAQGKSTFLVEMEETALICNQATANSLVILDEVGRGTSTFDGLAIAQAVVEYIYEHIKTFCLFATHYHELTLLSQKFSSIVTYYAASTKSPDGIILLHKILPGVADGSFGLEVAKLANLPQDLIKRATNILKDLEEKENNIKLFSGANKFDITENNLVNNIKKLEQEIQEIKLRKNELEAYISQKEQSNKKEHILAARIEELDVEQITAKQALDVLWQLKNLE